MWNLEFIVAKVRGMRGKLYEGERLSQLCDVRSVEDLATTLSPDEAASDAVGLERILTAQHVAALGRVLPALDGWEEEFWLWVLRRYQMENLKVILRCWATKSDGAAVKVLTVPVHASLELPTEAMMRAASLEDLLGHVSDPGLRNGALLGRDEFQESGRLFFVEAGLDKAYFAELDALAGRAPTASRDGVRRLVRLELDIYNVMVVLRGPFNYGMPFKKLRAFLAPVGERVRARALEQVCSAPDVAAAVARIPDGLVGWAADVETLDAVEAALWRTLYRAANRQYRESVLDFGAVVAFYYIKRVELSNLIRVCECMRYGERGDSIREKLIRVAGAEPARSR